MKTKLRKIGSATLLAFILQNSYFSLLFADPPTTTQPPVTSTTGTAAYAMRSGTASFLLTTGSGGAKLTGSSGGSTLTVTSGTMSYTLTFTGSGASSGAITLPGVVNVVQVNNQYGFPVLSGNVIYFGRAGNNLMADQYGLYYGNGFPLSNYFGQLFYANNNLLTDGTTLYSSNQTAIVSSSGTWIGPAIPGSSISGTVPAAATSSTAAALTGTSPNAAVGSLVLPAGQYVEVGDSITAGYLNAQFPGSFLGEYLTGAAASGSAGKVFSKMTCVNEGDLGSTLYRAVTTGSAQVGGTGAYFVNDLVDKWNNGYPPNGHAAGNAYLPNTTGTAAIYQVCAGANEYYQSWFSAPVYSGSLAAYYQLIHAGGGKVIAFTVTPRGDQMSAGAEANRKAINALIRSGSAAGLFWDYLEDRDARFGPAYTTNTNIASDGIHPTGFADFWEAQQMNNAFGGLPSGFMSAPGLDTLGMQNAAYASITGGTANVTITGTNPATLGITTATQLTTSQLNATGLATLGNISFYLSNSWNLDGSYADTTGTDTFTATGSPTFVAGLSGSAVSFSGTGQYIQGGQILAVTGSSFSVDFEMKPTAVATAFLVDEYYNSATHGGWGVTMHSDGSIHFTMSKNTPGDIEIQSPSSTVGTGTWTHIAASYNIVTGTMSLLVNGTLSSSGSFGTTWNQISTAYPFAVSGAAFSNSTHPDTYLYNGAIDCLHFYHYALTGTDAALLANSGAGQQTGTQQPYFLKDGSFLNVGRINNSVTISGSLAAGVATVNSSLLLQWPHATLTMTGTSAGTSSPSLAFSGSSCTITSGTGDSRTFDLEITPGL